MWPAKLSPAPALGRGKPSVYGPLPPATESARCIQKQLRGSDTSVCPFLQQCREPHQQHSPRWTGTCRVIGAATKVRVFFFSSPLVLIWPDEAEYLELPAHRNNGCVNTFFVMVSLPGVYKYDILTYSMFAYCLFRDFSKSRSRAEKRCTGKTAFKRWITWNAIM